MKAYLDLLKYIIDNGKEKNDRTNTGTISSFGHQLEFDLEDGFPAVTTKSLAWKGVVSELLWFLEGSDDERRLAEIRFNKVLFPTLVLPNSPKEKSKCFKLVSLTSYFNKKFFF